MVDNMKKSIIIIITIFCTCLIFLNFINVPVGSAVSYYNWIKGSEMETTTNQIEDGGFESGDFNSGVLYGNWSIKAGTPYFVTTFRRSGVNCMRVESGESVFYNFTDAIFGADIESFEFYVYSSDLNKHIDVYLYYSDSSSYFLDDKSIGGEDDWFIQDILSYVDEGKYLTAFSIDYDDILFYIDDCFLGIEDEYSQEQYDVDTYPWRVTGLLSYYQSIGYTDFPTFLPFITYRMYPSGALVDVDNIGHNLVWGRESNGSGYIGYDESTAQFVQDIDYLDSDSVHYVDLWAYTENDGEVSIKINIIYSDRTYDSKTVELTEKDDWEHLNFGGSWIDDNKYIVQVQISLDDYFAGYVNIDDIGIWSSLPSNSYRFTFTVSPSPLSQTSIGFNAYMGQTYTFTGYLWDINGELTENGTVTISHNYGSTVATLSSGIFTFTINPRSGTSDFTEQLGISVNNGDIVELYELTVQWIYTSGGGGGKGEEERANNLFDWLIMFIVIFLPALLFAGGIYENNQQPDSMHISPIFGLVAGLVLSIGIGVYTSLVPLWILILMIVALVVLIAGMVIKN